MVREAESTYLTVSKVGFVLCAPAAETLPLPLSVAIETGRKKAVCLSGCDGEAQRCQGIL